MALKVEKLRLLPQSKSYIHAWLYFHRITTRMKHLGLMKDALCCRALWEFTTLKAEEMDRGL